MMKGTKQKRFESVLHLKTGRKCSYLIPNTPTYVDVGCCQLGCDFPRVKDFAIVILVSFASSSSLLLMVAVYVIIVHLNNKSCSINHSLDIQTMVSEKGVDDRSIMNLQQIASPFLHGTWLVPNWQSTARIHLRLKLYQRLAISRERGEIHAVWRLG